MASSKGARPPRQPGVYRDDPDRDDAASTSSAVLLEDIDYPDEELPAYTDDPTPSIPVATSNSQPINFYLPPPELPFSSHDISCSEFSTRFPSYSTDANALFNMIQEQAFYPPSYFVELQGQHTETRRNGNKETKDKITDFYIRINLTPLLRAPYATNPVEEESPRHLQLLPNNKRGYRGGRIISLKPALSNDLEGTQSGNAELRAWCEKFVADKANVKSFTLKREVTNHDTKKLEQFLRSAIQETNYRGHLTINFPLQHERLIVYSPGFINGWRTTVWIRWVFYISMLWLLTWPFLIAVTARYEIVKAVYPYASKKPGDNVDRVPTVMSEMDWFHRWESAIKRAALARMKCEETCLDEEYRLQTEEADRRGEDLARAQAQGVRLPTTGNAFADGALGLLGQGMRIAENYSNARGWGGDC